MKPREKVLMAIVAGVLVLLAGREVSSRYVGARKRLDETIAIKQKDLTLLEAAQTEELRASADWRQLGKQTLSMDEKEAKTLLRDELVSLTVAAGLRDAEIALGLVGKRQDSGIGVLNSSLEAEGTLKNILGLLFKLHRQPYLVRCKSLTLTPVVERVHGKNKKVTRKSTGRFTMTVKLETLLLPPTEQVAKIVPAVLAKEERREINRTLLASAGDYAAIRQELFERYTAPPAKPLPRPDPPVHTTPRPEPDKPPQPPPPPPKDATMVVRSVWSSARGQQVVLSRDPRNPNAEEKRVDVGGEMFGGTLIFVHPTGGVTEQEDGTRRFHVIGLRLEEGPILSEDEHPLVFHELAKLEQRSEGITRAE